MLPTCAMFGHLKAINYGRYIFCRYLREKCSVDFHIAIKFYSLEILGNENGYSYKRLCVQLIIMLWCWAVLLFFFLFCFGLFIEIYVRFIFWMQKKDFTFPRLVLWIWCLLRFTSARPYALCSTKFVNYLSSCTIAVLAVCKNKTNFFVAPIVNACTQFAHRKCIGIVETIDSINYNSDTKI